MLNDNAVTRHSLMEMVFLLEVLDVILNIVFAGLGLGQLVSFTIAASYILVVCLLALLLFERTAYDGKCFFTYAGIIIISFFAVALSGSNISFAFMRKWLVFFCTFTLFFWAAYVKITDRMVRYLKYAVIFLACYFCFMYAAGRTYPLGYVGITFNLGNPNFTGMWLLAETLLLTSFLPRERKLWRRISMMVLVIAMLYFITLTNARSCLIAMAFFLLASIVFKSRFTRLILIAAIWFPLIFAVVYMEVVESEWFNVLFSFMVSEGKGLNSRVRIWGVGFNTFLNSPFWGNYYSATGGSGLGQLHNIYVDTLAAYGGIVQALVLGFLTFLVDRIMKDSLGNAQRTALYAFGAVLISGAFEAGLFSNSQGMYVLVAGLLLLSRYSQEKASPKVCRNVV